MTAEPTHITSTRTAYDTVAATYAERIPVLFDSHPLVRAVLGVFADMVRTAGGGRVADLGCGPGLNTSFLHERGVDVYGVDLSPEMVAIARRAYPGLRFDVGTLAQVDAPDGSLAGIVAYYSIIHTPRERLPEVFAEFARVLAPGGLLLVGFHVGDDPIHSTKPYGHDVSLCFHRFQPEDVVTLLREAGFVVRTRVLDEEERNGKLYRTADLFAVKPGV